MIFSVIVYVIFSVTVSVIFSVTVIASEHSYANEAISYQPPFNDSRYNGNYEILNKVGAYGNLN